MMMVVSIFCMGMASFAAYLDGVESGQWMFLPRATDTNTIGLLDRSTEW
jgi:hypothetical protein